MTYKYGNSKNDVGICRVGNVPEHGISLQYFVVVGLRCRNLHSVNRHLSQLKARVIHLI
jgi:hypothetical protein